jgi:hypothetical protein
MTTVNPIPFADRITTSMAAVILAFDFAFVPTITFISERAATPIPWSPPPWLMIGLLTAFPVLIYVIATRVSRRLLKNRIIAGIVALVGYFVLVTAHWGAVYVLGHSDPPASSVDNAPGRSLLLIIFVSYLLGIVFSILAAFWFSLLAALRSVRQGRRARLTP